MTYLNQIFNLENKVAVITGGNGVLAGKMAEGLLKSGAKVVLLDIKEESVVERTKALSQYGSIRGLSCDVLNRAVLENVKEEVIAGFGKIDILINAAGATIAPDQAILDMEMDDFNKVTEGSQYFNG